MARMRGNPFKLFVFIWLVVSAEATTLTLSQGKNRPSGRNNLPDIPTSKSESLKSSKTLDYDSAYECLYVFPDLPICDIERMEDSEEDITHSTADYYRETKASAENFGKSHRPRIRRNVVGMKALTEDSPGRQIIVYTIEGCLPSSLPFAMPSCQQESSHDKILEVRKLYPFTVKGLTRAPLIFPEFNFDRWTRMMKRLRSHASTSAGRDEKKKNIPLSTERSSVMGNNEVQTTTPMTETTTSMTETTTPVTETTNPMTETTTPVTETTTPMTEPTTAITETTTPTAETIIPTTETIIPMTETTRIRKPLESSRSMEEEAKPRKSSLERNSVFHKQGKSAKAVKGENGNKKLGRQKKTYAKDSSTFPRVEKANRGDEIRAKEKTQNSETLNTKISSDLDLRKKKTELPQSTSGFRILQKSWNSPEDDNRSQQEEEPVTLIHWNKDQTWSAATEIPILKSRGRKLETMTGTKQGLNSKRINFDDIPNDLNADTNFDTPPSLLYSVSADNHNKFNSGHEIIDRNKDFLENFRRRREIRLAGKISSQSTTDDTKVHKVISKSIFHRVRRQRQPRLLKRDQLNMYSKSGKFSHFKSNSIRRGNHVNTNDKQQGFERKHSKANFVHSTDKFSSLAMPEVTKQVENDHSKGRKIHKLKENSLKIRIDKVKMRKKFSDSTEAIMKPKKRIHRE